MNSELVQTGFFDLESVASDPNEITIIADWMALPDDDFEQIVEERLIELDQQEAAIDAFVKALKSNIIRERGELYMAAKAKLPHGRYLKLLKRRGVEPRTAQEYALITREHGTELSNAQRAAHLGFRTWQRIVRSPEKHQIVAKIETGEVEATPKAINAELEAAKQRAKELEDRLEAERKALTLFKDEVEANEQAHVALVQSLEQKLEEKPEPVKVIEYRDTLETAARFAALKEQIEALESKPAISPEKQKELDKLQLDLKNAQTELGFYEKQNKALAEHVTQLSEESRRSFSENIIAVGQLRIRQNWQFATGEVQAALRKFITRVPSDIDRESFEGEEHTRTAQTIEVLEQTAALLKKTLLGSDTTGMIDADTPTTITHTQPALPCPTNPTNPTNLPSPQIPSNHDELFAQYKQFVNAWPEPKLWWRAPEIGIMDMEMDKELHVHYTRELLKSGDPYRMKAALEGMKRTLGYSMAE